MTAMKTMIVSLLSSIAGILVGFGSYSLAVRDAIAAPAGAVLPPSVDVAAVTSAGQPAVGPGSNFVTRVYKEVSPTVVHITSTAESFDIFRGPVEQEATGSGVIIDADGYIMTNAHVIAGADRLTVILYDGSRYESQVVGVDPGTDLALLKIDCPDPLPVAKLGDSEQIEVGEWVIAIGNPRGFDWTVTTGVVSAMGRNQPAFRGGPTIYGLIQTDAAINPGNSGGPLLNAVGEVIGINERISSVSGGSEGIGLAIPINTAKTVLQDLKQHGRVQRPWLGITAAHQIDPQMARAINFPVTHGVVIGNVRQNSPAAKAGLSPAVSVSSRQFRYDVITKINGKDVTGAQALLDSIRNRKPGDTLKLEIYRVVDGRYNVMQVDVAMTEVPAREQVMGYI